MNVGVVVLLFLLGVVLSSLLSRAVPFLPRPLVQIGFGAILGALSPWTVELDPALFFLLIVPPLLFIDGWRLPNDAALSEAPTILTLALVLVFATVTAIGMLLHLLLPQMPLAVAFALAAIISPTDPVSVTAITARVPMPPRLTTILQGEALLNDSVGLVCFKFAVAAIATGGFSLLQAGADFLWLAIAGVVIGAAVSWISVQANHLLGRHLGAEAGATALVTLLIPFGAYLLADAVGASGVLAAAASGLAMTMRLAERLGSGAHRLERRAIWDMLSYTLNGVTFVLLGEQLPRLIEHGLKSSGDVGWATGGDLALRLLAVLAALVAIRMGIVAAVFVAVPGWRRTWAAENGPRFLPLIATISVAAPRGAVTLAGILTLPTALSGGAALPSRDLAILIAAAIIVATTALTAGLLPLCLKWMRWSAADETPENLIDADLERTKAALKAIEAARDRLSSSVDDQALLDAVADEVADFYQKQRSGLDPGSKADARELRDRLRLDLEKAALAAERQAVARMRADRRITVSQAMEIDRRLDLRDAVATDRR